MDRRGAKHSEIATCLAHQTHAAPLRLDGKTADERGAAMVRYVAGVKPAAKDETYPKAAAPCYAARLVLNIETQYALEKLHAAASHQLAKGRDRIAQQTAYDQTADKSSLKRPGSALDPFDKASSTFAVCMENPYRPYALHENRANHDMLWCEARQNGWILETSELKPFAGGGVDAELDRFAEAILSQTKMDLSAIDSKVPSLKYRTLTGRILEFQWQPHAEPYNEHLKVDGSPFDRFL